MKKKKTEKELEAEDFFMNDADREAKADEEMDAYWESQKDN